MLLPSNAQSTLKFYIIKINHAKFYSPKTKIPFMINALIIFNNFTRLLINNIGDEFFLILLYRCVGNINVHTSFFGEI
jgi:hypothetical protein